MGVNCIPALPRTTMEKLVENVSLVNMNIAGTPTATPGDAEENETDEMQKESGQARKSRHLSAKTGGRGRVDACSVHSSCDVL